MTKGKTTTEIDRELIAELVAAKVKLPLAGKLQERLNDGHSGITRFSVGVMHGSCDAARVDDWITVDASIWTTGPAPRLKASTLVFYAHPSELLNFTDPLDVLRHRAVTTLAKSIMEWL